MKGYLLYGMLAVTGFSAALAGSYGAIRMASGGGSSDQGTTSARLADAQFLRAASNELVELANLFYATQQSHTDQFTFTRWKDDRFRPRLNSLRRRLIHAPLHDPGVTGLMDAADRLYSATALSPEHAFHEKVRAQVREASSYAEERIKDWHAAERIAPPPLATNF